MRTLPGKKITQPGTDEIYLAAINGNTAFFKDLKNAKGNIDISDPHDNDNSALQKCIHESKTAAAELLLDCGADPLHVNAIKDCSLHNAACMGNLKILRTLYKYTETSNVLMRPGWLKYQPIHFAAVEGKKQILEWLLNHTVDVDARDEDNYTALHLAVWEGHLNCVLLLLRNNASLNATCKRGQNALDLALEVGHTEIANILVKAGGKKTRINGYY